MRLIWKVRPARLHLFLLAVFFFAWSNSVNPVLRFNNDDANLIFEGMIYLFPLILFVNGFRFKTWRAKIINAVCVFLPMVLCLFFAALAMSWFIRGENPRAQLVDTVNAGAYKIKAIQTIGSAISSPIFRFQQEKNIGLGLLLVKEIYRAKVVGEEPKIISLKKNELEFYDVYGKKKVVSLKPYIYF